VRFRAQAPGKLVIVGEYAVLSGAPALVMAVDRHSRASVGPSPDALCHLETRLATVAGSEIEPGSPSGTVLVDTVVASAGELHRVPAWSGILDSSEFFDGGTKLGLGSSAAALCAWAGAWYAYARANGAPLPALTATALVDLHRAFQHGAGSGLDVAASFSGGVVRYALDADQVPQIGSVQLPNSVGFAGIFTGSSASTPEFVSRYLAWTGAEPAAAAAMRRTLGGVAEAACEAATDGNGEDFLAAVSEYGARLEELGLAMRADVVTSEHRRIGLAARKFGVVYKVSGAGGGDLGLALSAHEDSLSAFTQAVAGMGFAVVDVAIDQQGLVVEELT
jgi:phosphomevalonate kinase